MTSYFLKDQKLVRWLEDKVRFLECNKAEKDEILEGINALWDRLVEETTRADEAEQTIAAINEEPRP